MAKEIIMITGGQRSGKSMFAEQLALSKSDSPVYVATAEARDDEFRDRVRRHQLRRGKQWTTIEEQLHISKCELEDRVVLVDCMTMLSTNFFFANDEDIDKAFAALCNELDAFTRKNCTFIFVTNEIGMGGISDNAMMRKFTDLLGFTNKYLAEISDIVYFMVSGIPMKIK